MPIQILVLKHGWLIVVFEQGREPAYYRNDWLGMRMQAAISGPENLRDGLPVDALIGQLVEQGFTLTCRKVSPTGDL